MGDSLFRVGVAGLVLGLGIAGVSLTAHAVGPYAYVADTSVDKIRVLDAGTTPVALLASIDVGDSPFGVAVHPGRGRVYVTNSDSGNVSVVDSTSNTVIATVPVGSFPAGVAVNPAGTRVYVAVATGFQVKVIDTATNAVVSTLSGFSIPWGVAISPDGSRLYVTNSGDDTLSVIDTASLTEVARIPVGQGPFGVAVNPAGTRVYVVNSVPDTLSVIDTASNTVLTTVQVRPPAGSDPTFSVAVNPAGSRVYVSVDQQTTDNVYEIDAATNTVSGAFDLQDNFAFEIWGLNVDPSGNRLYLVSGQYQITPPLSAPGAFWVVDANTGSVLGILPGLSIYARAFGNFMSGCTTDAVCNDGNECTTDACVNFACVHSCAVGQPCGGSCGMVCSDAGGCHCDLP